MPLKDFLFYQDDWATIYCGDCLEIMPLMEPESVDLVVTDPPYPDFNEEHGKEWEQTPMPYFTVIRQFIFWPSNRDFPYSWTARHVWHKPNGQSQQHYEFIYERYGETVYRVWRIPIINYETLPEWTPHPTQKPLHLVKEILNLCKFQYVLDPFLGSGTTCVAAKNLNRKSIGIEINPKYCEIAVKRLRQEVFDFRKEIKP